MSRSAAFYFQYIWGDKDTFRWGFKATKTPYFLNPNYLSSVGIIADKDHPYGGVALKRSSNRINGAVISKKAEDQWTYPNGARFCGHNMLQFDFDMEQRDSYARPRKTFKPTPLFMHANLLKHDYIDEIAPFQVAEEYVFDSGNRIEDYGFNYLDVVFGRTFCIELKRVDVPIRVYSK